MVDLHIILIRSTCIHPRTSSASTWGLSRFRNKQKISSSSRLRLLTAKCFRLILIYPVKLGILSLL